MFSFLVAFQSIFTDKLLITLIATNGVWVTILDMSGDFLFRLVFITAQWAFNKIYHLDMLATDMEVQLTVMVGLKRAVDAIKLVSGVSVMILDMLSYFMFRGGEL